MKTLLWLDDIRDPKTETWLKDFAPYYTISGDVVWVKNFNEFVDYIIEHPMPDLIAFDHDLGEDISLNKIFYGMTKRQARKEKKLEKSGMDAAKWLIEYCMDNDIELPMWIVQSANPVGRDNINSLLLSYLKSLK